MKTQDKQIKVGDLVLQKNVPIDCLNELYLGHYEVVEIIGPENLKIRKKNRLVTVHKT